MTTESFGELSFDDTLKAIAKEAERKSQESPLDAAPAEVPAEAPKPSASVPDVPVPEAKVSQPQSALVRKALEREAELIQLRNKLKDLEEKPAAPPAPSLEQLRLLYKRNKIEALKALDPNFKPGVTAKELWYHDLGDLAPKEAKVEMEALGATNSVEALREEMEAKYQQIIAEMNQRQADQAYEQYVGATQAYVKAVPDDLPLVGKFSTKKPEKVVQALTGVARKHYQATGEVLTPGQAASKLEESLRELQFNEPASVPQAPVNPKPEVSAGPPNTLRNKHTSVQPTRVETDELDDEVLRQRARAALEAESRKRASRGY